MACRLFEAKPLPEPMLTYCELDILGQITLKFETNYDRSHSREWLSLTAVRETADIGVHVVHSSCVILAYTLESLYSLI